MTREEELRAGILRTSSRLGINPEDLATAISFETGGTFDPWQAGPTTKWGQHRGLIQWGEPQRKEYGVTKDSSITEQMDAVTRYLYDAGVRPGMGMLDVYSAINAGRVGRYNASDTAAGGTPGTVRDKVDNQMLLHRLKAQGLLGEQSAAPVSPAMASAAAAGRDYTPGLTLTTTPPAADTAGSDILANMKALGENPKVMGGLEGIIKGLGMGQPKQQDVAMPSAPSNGQQQAALATAGSQIMASLLAARRKTPGLSLTG